MFDPNRSIDSNKAKQERNDSFKRIEQWCTNLMEPGIIRDQCIISVQEVICGDPKCAPVDTLIAFTFPEGGQGMLSLPMKANEITENDLQYIFPPNEIFEKWYNGEDALWPPADDDDMMMDGTDQLKELRFELGTKVLCRVGPTDWAAGKIIQLWYRETNWPEYVFAPYKILLEDGRSIFAPQDMEQIIRLDPNAPENASALLQTSSATTASSDGAADTTTTTTTTTSSKNSKDDGTKKEEQQQQPEPSSSTMTQQSTTTTT